MKSALLALLCIATTASAQLREWNDYRTVLWMGGQVEKHKDQWPLIAQRMKEMGINTGMGNRDAPPQHIIDSGFGYYVENIINKGLCLKFSSSVTNWSKFVDEWSKTRSADAFVRDYCFDDPKWLGSVTDIMSKAAAAHAAAKPLMYDLRDELSVTISANPFDYDFSPLALAGFRDWLKTQYPDLAALNAQWDTEFKTWDDVMPFSTDQIKRRMVTGEKHPQGEPDWSQLKGIKFDPAEAAKNPVRWNFSPWCDHRTYMDLSLARTLGKLRDAARAKDPHTPVGIEGLQMPSAFGGYDLWRLSQVLDWAEPYDVGNSREILGSFMEGKPMVCTVFEKDTDHAKRRLWHLLLLGDRGCIVWWSEDVIDWTKPDLPLTDKAKALAPVLKEMQSPLAKLFILAKREWDPIAIHYSQPSIQVAWLLESCADGKTWPRRFSSYESTHNQHAQVRNSWLKLLQDLGYSPRFVSDEEFSQRRDSAKAGQPEYHVLVRPRAWAASEDGRGETNPSFYDQVYGMFDGKGKLRVPRTEDMISRVNVLLGEAWANGLDTGVAWLEQYGNTLQKTPQVTPLGDYVQVRGELGREESYALLNLRSYATQRQKLEGGEQASETASHVLSTSGIHPPIRVPIEARVRTHRLTLGQARLLAFERNIDYTMSEDLAQAGGNEQLEKPVTFTASWNGENDVYDLRTGKHLGRTSQIEVNLDPWQPSLYALLPAKVEGDVVKALLNHKPLQILR